MKGSVIVLALAIAAMAQPLLGQGTDTLASPHPKQSGAGTLDLPPKVCPSDRTDGPLLSGGKEYYGIPAQRIVEGFLAPPHDSYGRVQSGTQSVPAGSLRILTDATDYNACLRLTTFITGGSRSAPAPATYVYFTAGGFYFVSQWKRAQSLDNYTTSYGHVMVFDSAFNLLGAYAF